MRDFIQLYSTGPLTRHNSTLANHKNKIILTLFVLQSYSKTSIRHKSKHAN